MKTKKLLLILQCYHGDQDAAMDLARLIADIEPKQSEHADFLFAHRFDTTPDTATQDYVSEKFENVYSFVAEKMGTGWPAGCNDLFFDTLNLVTRRTRDKHWEYDAALFFESDAVPLAVDWIKRLKDDYYNSGALINGHYITESQFETGHVNGNCVMSTSFGRIVRSFCACPDDKPWDIYHAPSMVLNVVDHGLIHSVYRLPTITPEALFAAQTRPHDHPLTMVKFQPVLFHGVKDDSARRAVRARLC
jgi:hypothetical protein